MSIVLHDDRLALVASLSLLLLFKRLLRMRMTMVALMVVVMRMMVLGFSSDDEMTA